MLYIRHAEKLHRNGDAIQFSLDPGLTEQGREAARVKFINLVKQYEIPPKIITSPYLRAHQTADIAQTVIFEETGKTVDIYCDPNILQY